MIMEIGTTPYNLSRQYGKSIDYIAYPGIENQKEQRGATLISVDSKSGYNITPLRFE